MNYIFDNKTSEKETLEKMSAKIERVKIGLRCCHGYGDYCDCDYCPYQKYTGDGRLECECSEVLGNEALEVLEYLSGQNELPEGAAESNEEVKTNESGTQE